jgi:hypothetical protein
MANARQLDLLRRGVESWNAWRRESTDSVDLRNADLRGLELGQADLVRADLSRAKLDGVNLWLADLEGATLRLASLPDTRMESANLIDADLTGANLRQADMGAATLGRAVLKMANLAGVRLAGADLSHVDLTLADVTRTDFSGATFNRTLLCGLNLGKAVGLDRALHRSPSSLAVDTLLLSRGSIPEPFLRGCGLPDDLISYSNALARAPIEFYSCFISHSTRDQAFAERLHADLQSRGVRCWYAPEDLKIGADIRESIDESIRAYDKLLIVLSEGSVQSPWVASEVRLAMEKEQRLNKRVLFPIRLDDTVTVLDQPWSNQIVKERNIGDFRLWKEHDAYRHAFDRLLRDLKA